MLLGIKKKKRQSNPKLSGPHLYLELQSIEALLWIILCFYIFLHRNSSMLLDSEHGTLLRGAEMDALVAATAIDIHTNT